MAGSRREVFRIADLVVTFQEEPGLDCYLVFELQETKVKTSVVKNAGSQAGVRFTDNLMLPKPDWSGDAPPGADELLVKAYRHRDGRPDSLLGAAIITMSELPPDGKVQAQLLMRQDAFGGVMDFKVDGAGFGDTVVRSTKVVNASDQEYNDQSVPVGTVVSRRVVSSIPEGMDEGAPMTPQQPRQHQGAALLGAGAAAGVPGIGREAEGNNQAAGAVPQSGAAIPVDYAANKLPANGGQYGAREGPGIKPGTAGGDMGPGAAAASGQPVVGPGFGPGGGNAPLDKEGSNVSSQSAASRRPAIVPFKPGGGNGGQSRPSQTPPAAEALKAEGAATRPGVSATEASGVQGLGRGLERHRAAAQGDDGHEGRRLQGEAFGAAAGVLGAAAAMRRQQMDRGGQGVGERVSNSGTPFGKDGIQANGNGQGGPGTQNNAQNVNVKTNVSQQGGAGQQQGGGLPLGAALGGAAGATITHHHYHTHNHGGGPEVSAAMGLDQASTPGTSTVGKGGSMSPSMTPPMTPSRTGEQSLPPPSSHGNGSSQASPAPSFTGAATAAAAGAAVAEADGKPTAQTTVDPGPARGLGKQSASSITITDIQARLLHHSSTARPYVAFHLGTQKVTTEPFKTKSTDLQPVVIVGESMTLAVDVTDLNPANHVLRVLLYNKRSVRGDALIGLSSVALGAIVAAAVDGAAMVQLTLEDRIDRRPTGTISFHVHVTPSAIAGVETADGGDHVGEKQGGAVYGDKLAAEQ